MTSIPVQDFKSIFESLPGLYLILKPDFTIAGVSDGYLSATMTERETIVGRRLFDVFPDNPEDQAATGVSNLQASLHYVLAKGEPHMMEPQKYDIRRQDGTFEERYWSPLNTPIFDENKTLIYIIHNVADITAHQLAEERLRKNERDFQILISGVKDYAIFMIARDGRVASWNSGAENITGYKTAEVIGRVIDIFYTEDDKRQNLPRHNLQAAFQYGHFETEGWRQRKDGTRIYCNTAISALKDDTGHLYGYSEITRDITERKNSEQQLRLLASQIDQSNDAIFTTDANLSINSWNRGAQNLYGFSKSEILGENANERLGTGFMEEELAIVLRELANDGYWTRQIRQTTKAGKEIFVRASSTAIKDDNGRVTGYIAIGFDITEQKKLTTQLNHFANIVEQSSEAIISRGANKRLISWNKGAEILFGYTREEAIGKRALELGILRTSEAERAQMELDLSEKGCWHAEHEYFNKDGHSFFGDLTANAVKDELGNVSSVVFIVKDVSDRRRLEDHLRKSNEELEDEIKARTSEIINSEKKYRYLFEDNPLPMWVVDEPDFRILDVNKTAIRHYGYSREEFLSMTALDIRPAEDKKPFLDSTIIHERNPETRNVGIWNHLKKDGSIIKVEVSAQSFQFEDKRARLILANDVTQRLASEEQLASSEKRFRTILENNNDIIALMDASFKVVYRSPSASRITGWTAEDMQTRDVTENIHPEELAKVGQLFKEILAHPGMQFPVSFRTLHKKGHYLYLEGVITNSLQEEAVKAIVFNCRDITERRIMQDQLLEREAQLQLFIDHSPVALAMFDKEMRYIAVSHRWVHDYRIEKSKMIGRSYYETFPEISDDWKNIHQRCLAGAVEKCDAELFVLPNGQQTWIRWEIHPWYKASAAIGGIIIFTEEITERLLAEKSIKDLNAELEERVLQRTDQLRKINSELESFSYSVSHDLRAPLRIIDGFSRILTEDYAPNLDAEGRRTIEVIVSSARKMGQLIDDLLNFSRTGRSEMRISKVDMNKLVKEVLNDFANSGIVIPGALSVHKLKLARGDHNLLKQVWSNLISNAIKYSSGSKKSVIEIGMVRDEDHNVYYVKDNGAGFDMRYADKLFGVFQRLHREDEFSGTGVGLALVQRIILRHSGTIWADAKINEGAVFYFTLGDL